MLKLVKWETDDKEMNGSQHVWFNKITLFKGQWEGLLFSIEGLGISKSDKLLGLNIKTSNVITVYFAKWGVSYNKRGYEDTLRNVNVTLVKELI